MPASGPQDRSNGPDPRFTRENPNVLPPSLARSAATTRQGASQAIAAQARLRGGKVRK
jgi:hypothetical protein